MQFPTTRWDELARASLHGDTEARAALDEFCRRYWQPVNGFVRWKGFDQADADDLTQDFFLNFIETRSWRRADRLRGSFRAFLLGALTHHLQKAQAHQTRLKRGGGALPISLDQTEHASREEMALPPEDAAHFDRVWAVRLLDVALTRTREEYAAKGKERTYAALKCFLTVRRTPPSYEEVARALGLTLGGIKTEIHRLRQAFRAALRLEIGRTVSAPHEVEEELRHLQSVWLSQGHVMGNSGET